MESRRQKDSFLSGINKLSNHHLLCRRLTANHLNCMKDDFWLHQYRGHFMHLLRNGYFVCCSFYISNDSESGTGLSCIHACRKFHLWMSNIICNISKNTTKISKMYSPWKRTTQLVLCAKLWRDLPPNVPVHPHKHIQLFWLIRPLLRLEAVRLLLGIMWGLCVQIWVHGVLPHISEQS